MRMTLNAAAMAMIFVPGAILAETNSDDSEAIMSKLKALSEECSSLESGMSQSEIFGIEIIRVGDTCAIVNGDELDERVRLFLEEQNLLWAGVGIWVKASGARQAD